MEKDEVLVALRDKVPTAQFLASHNILSENNNNHQHKKHDKHTHHKKQKYNKEPKVEIEDDEVSLMKDMLKEFEGTGCGAILDEALNITKEVSIEDIYEEIKNIEGSADTVIFDGIISQRLVDVSSKKGIKKLVAFRSNIVKKPYNLKIITIE